MEFPRIIHAIWIGPKPAPRKLLDTWAALNPKWEFRLHISDRGWRNQRQIDLMPELNGKADIMRFELLAKHGGVYVDADEECLQPLDALDQRFLEHESWCCWENETCRPGMMATTVLGARPGSRLFNELVNRVPTCNLKVAAWECVGPAFLTRIGKHHRETHVFPARHFLPEHYTGTPAPGDAPIFGRHHWGNTQAVLTRADIYGKFV